MPKADLKRLQREWYKRLADEGFEDLEVSPRARDPGAILDGARFIPIGPRRAQTAEQLSEASDYHDRCRFVLKRLRDPGERRVWELHTDGLTMREIARDTGYRLERVHTLINRIQAREGVKGVNGVKSRGRTRVLSRMIERMDVDSFLQVFG